MQITSAILIASPSLTLLRFVSFRGISIGISIIIDLRKNEDYHNIL